MKILMYSVLFVIAVIYPFQADYSYENSLENSLENSSEESSDNSRDSSLNTDLNCIFDIEPKAFSKKQATQLSFTLENNSSSDISVAKSVTNNELIWFRLSIQDENGNIILTGKENESMATDDLPELIIVKLESHKMFSIKKCYILDSGFRMNSYNLKPGKYLISAIYRFEPEKEPYAAGFYKHESETNDLWTGSISSKPVEIKILE